MERAEKPIKRSLKLVLQYLDTKPIIERFLSNVKDEGLCVTTNTTMLSLLMQLHCITVALREWKAVKCARSNPQRNAHPFHIL